MTLSAWKRTTNSLNRDRIGYAARQPETLELKAMLRVRLKADGRLVEILSDGSEGPISISNGAHAPHVNGARHATNARFIEAAYARNVREGRLG